MSRQLIMSADDVIERLRAEYNVALSRIKAGDDAITDLRAENNMLKSILAQRPEMREGVRALLAELRSINHWIQNGKERQAKSALSDLLRRFDRESDLV